MRSVPRDTGPTGAAAGDHLSTAALFALLWEGLADILGTAAAAALLRRAAGRATGRCPELAALIVVRENLDYTCTIPAAWHDHGGTPAALGELCQELRTLLVELTGSVVVGHLARIPELRERGIRFVTEEDPP